jgi:release factor glutamine methyltransferase
MDTVLIGLIIIVANPPYLTREEFESAEDEIKKYEPEWALIAVDNGLRDIRSVLHEAPLLLEEDSFVVLEVGMGHAAILRREYGKVFRKVDVFQDLLQCDRFLLPIVRRWNFVPFLYVISWVRLFKWLEICKGFRIYQF